MMFESVCLRNPVELLGRKLRRCCAVSWIGSTLVVEMGVGSGNTISCHSTSGKLGIACPNAGVASCAAGENVFSGNATGIDPACAATCSP